MEPRARAGCHKGTLNFPEELRSMLFAAGTPGHPDHLQPLPSTSDRSYSDRYLHTLPTENKSHPPTPFVATLRDPPNTGNKIPEPFPETLRVLDEIVTDYIIEISHAALQVATYAGRAKLKLADFEFVMRRDRRKLGRVQEMFRRKRIYQETKKKTGAGGIGEAGDMTELRRMGARELQDIADFAGEEGTRKGIGKGRGRRRKRDEMEEVDGVTGVEAVDQLPTMRGGRGDAAGDEDDLADLDVGVDDLEADEEEGAGAGAKDKHRSKRARSEFD